MYPRSTAFGMMFILIMGGHPCLGGDIDDKQLLLTLDALQAPLRSLYCEYEGERVEDREVIGNDGVLRLYSGIFRYKNPDNYINEIYHDVLATKINLRRMLITQTILSTRAGTQVFSRGDGTSGKVQSRHVSSSDFEVTGSYGTIFLARSLREGLKYEKKLLVAEGPEVVDGIPCERYAIVMGKQPYSIETGLVERFWVDLERNGHPLKKEVRSGGQRLATVDQIELKRYEGKSGPAWVPVKGRLTLSDIETTEPSREFYRVLQGSVRIGDPIPDVQFTAKYPIGTPVSDHLRGVVYEFGQDKRPAPKSSTEAQSRLDENLAKAAEGRSEFVAASWSRGCWIDWAVWGPISASVIFGLLAGILYLLRSRGGA